MANNDLSVKISADAKEFKQALDQVNAAVNAFGEKLKDIARPADQGFKSLEKSINSTAKSLAGLLVAQKGIDLTKNVIETADSFQQLNGRLKLVTSSSDEFVNAQKELLKVAQSTGTNLSGTVDLYSKLARNTQGLKLSQEQLIAVTKTVNQTIQLSGASTEAAQAAMLQFGQALASPKFHAEELNSIIEQTPELARAIERGLGIAQGSLKNYAEKTGLTAQEAVGALLKVSSEIDETFSKLPSSVGRALTRLQNEITQSVGKTDLSPLVKSIDELRNTVSDPSVIKGIQDIAAALVTLTSKATSASSEVANFSKWVGESLASAVNGPAPDDLVRIADRIDLLKKRIQSLENAPLSFLNADQIKEYKDELGKLEGNYKKFAEAQGRAALAGSKEKTGLSAADLKAQGDAQIAAGKAALEKIKADAEAQKKEEGRKKSIESLLESLNKQAATYGKNAADTADYEMAVLGATEAERNRAKEIGSQIDALKAKEKAERDAIETTKKAEETAKKAAEKEKELAKQREEVRARFLAAQGNTPEAKGVELRAQYEKLIEELQARGDQAGVDLINSLINLEVADTRLSQLKNKIDKSVSSLKSTEESIGNRVIAGDTSPATGKQELQGARDKSITDLQSYRTELQALSEKDVPGAADALKEVDVTIAQIQGQSLTGVGKAIQDLRADLNKMSDNAASDAALNLRDGLNSLFNDLAEGSKNGEKALKDFVRGFARSMAQMAERALATYAVLQLLQAMGVPAPALMAFSGEKKHTGGVVGRGKKIPVDPSLFAFAPRYHVGGVAGLKPGEIPAILQSGEEVLSRRDPRNVMNGGGSSGTNIRIVNAIDMGIVRDYMSSSEGEEVHLNVIQRNANKIKHILS